MLLSSHSALAQFSQQGQKLVGSGAVGSANQGFSVSLSADGNTAIVGGLLDSSNAGAAWIWTRSGGVWTQQGGKLVGSGAVGAAMQGHSVSLSADGNTAVVGGFLDNNNGGAIWVWTRNGGVWTQQGTKLVGSGAVGATVYQGESVCISADGNTVIEGGSGDNNAFGAAWIWTRSGGVWTQQGSKLVGSGAANGSYGAAQGASVALSADGNTAIVGAVDDNNFEGAAWVWTRSGGVWTQQGNKLVGSNAVPPFCDQGRSVSLSADGNTAIVGGYSDNGGAGAAWVWTRSGGVWTQQGAKLVGSGASGTATQGTGVSLSSDGSTAIVGGGYDNSQAGAAWVWGRTGGVWTQLGSKLVGSGAVGASVGQGDSVALSADGNTAIVGGELDSGNTGAVWVFGAADLTITKSHSGNFLQRDTGDAYTITVTNSGSAATSGMVSVADTLPTGLTPTAPNGTVNGWSCSINGQTLTCTRSDVLAASGSYPAIALLVNVASNAASSVTNTATVSGGGEISTANDSASDPTTINPASAPSTPTGVLASAVSSTQVGVVWNVVPAANSYQIDRQAAGGVFSQIGTSATAGFSDTTALTNTAYLYRVRAVNGFGPSPSSAADLATTVIFADDPLVAGSTTVQAVHLVQLRTAVDAVRILAGLGSGTYTDSSPVGIVVKAVHITELRAALDSARGALSLSTGGYTDGSLAGVGIKAVHFQELRDRVR